MLIMNKDYSVFVIIMSCGYGALHPISHQLPSLLIVPKNVKIKFLSEISGFCILLQFVFDVSQKSEYKNIVRTERKASNTVCTIVLHFIFIICGFHYLLSDLSSSKKKKEFLPQNIIKMTLIL